MRNIRVAELLVCIFILNAASALDTLLTRRCPNQGAAPSVPYSHCGYNPQIPCPGNSASDRGLWCQCDICTDPETFLPYTGVTRFYDFSINATWGVGPDGYIRVCYSEWSNTWPDYLCRLGRRGCYQCV